MAGNVEIRWSRKAIRQVQQIARHIELDSPWQAQRVVQKIYAIPEGLSWSPAKGRIVPEYGDSTLREITVFSWRVIYRLKEPGLIEIAAVVHGKRILRDELLG